MKKKYPEVLLLTKAILPAAHCRYEYLKKTVAVFLFAFSIAITAIAAPPPPGNDICTSATLLTSATACTNTAGTLFNATATAALPACGNANSADVWYRFVAQTAYPSIKLSAVGTDLNTASPRIQLFSGVCGSLVQNVCGAALTTTPATSLTVGNTYYVRITTNTNTGVPVAGAWGFNICIVDLPDLCSNAILLTSNTTCSNTAGTLLNATPTAALPACGNAGSADVWYKFVAKTAFPKVTLSNVGTDLNGASPRTQIFSGVCGSLVQNICGTGLTTIPATGLTIGSTYYVRVTTNTNTGVQTTGAWGFNICITDVPDFCTNAQLLTSGITCVNTAGTLLNASATPALPACGNAASPDVWYKFVAKTAYPTVTLSSAGTNLNTAVPLTQIFSGACGSLVQNICNNTLTTTPATGLTIGATYYVRITTQNLSALVSSGTYDFNICITDPPDVCATAALLTSGTSCVNTAGTLLKSSPTASLPACGNAGSADVWYKFVAQTGFPTITLSAVGANLSAAAPMTQIFSGACGSLTQIVCSNTLATTPAGALTIGTTYYVRITTNTNTGFLTTGAWSFNICITDLNDACGTATLLTSGITCVNTAGSFINSTPTTGLPACGNAGSADVWYQFVAQTAFPTVTLSGVGANLSGATPITQILTGNCGALLQVACGNTLSTIPTIALTPGATYYVRITTNTNTGNVTSGAWGFNICITDPNDDCATATLLTSAAACSNTAGSLLFATQTAASLPACGNASSPDVWYKFVAQTTFPVVNLSSVGANFSAAGPRIQIFSGTCGALVQNVCGTTLSTASATALTVGTTYYVRITTNTNTGVPTTGAWDFNICITDPNDICASATLLTSGSNCVNTAGSLLNATSTASLPVCGNPNSADVWYKFVAQSAFPTVALSSVGASLSTASPMIQIFSGTCGLLTQNVCAATLSTMPATALTIGSTYYVRITTSTNTGVPTSGTWGFNICITDPPDICATAALLISGGTCNITAGTLLNATATPLVAAACANVNSADVWYRFVAQSTFPTVALSNVGANLNTAGPRIQIFSGASCASLTQNVCGTTLAVKPATALTVGTIYYVRILTNTNTGVPTTGAWDFNICITDLPDDCANAATLTSSTACNNTRGTLLNATVTPAGSLPAAACGNTNSADVWYKFVAKTAYPLVTLSNPGANFNAAGPRVQVLSNICSNAATVFYCGISPARPTSALTPGTTYFVRITTNTNTGNITTGTWDFDICITDPPDICDSAILLTSGTACVNTAGSLLFATASSPVVPGSCGIAASPDVWYKFVAQTAYPQINLSTIGNNLRTNGRVHLLTGTCGALTSVYCHNIPNSASTTLNTAVNPGGAGLNVGQTYFVRITHNTLAATVTSGTYDFNICITNPPAAKVEFGKSYDNIMLSNKNGGSVKPGDTLVFKTELVINAGTIDSLMYIDTLYNGRGVRLVPGSISLQTNEGVLYKAYTDAFADFANDGGYRYTNGLDTIIRINMGTGASATARGSLSVSSKPSNYNVACIVMATYKGVVYAPYDTKIGYKTGGFQYRDVATGNFTTTKHFADTLLVYNAATVCPDAFSPTNLIGDEFGGTFGTAKLRDRGVSSNVPPVYGYQAFNGPAQGPNDYYYSIANNTSNDFTALQNYAKPHSGSAPNKYRVFGVWDITGDHTNATNLANGNKPCDTTQPVSATNPCGYMLVVNSAYHTDTVFQYTATNLCENTYYEISAWFKNICARCSCDSNGTGNTSTSPVYIAGTPGDSSGVKPNISFDIAGINYYSTGNLQHLGLGNGPGWTQKSDTANKWVRRGFVYKLAPGASSISFTLTNQAPGGGGNDWAIDDIAIKTCSPGLTYSPSVSPVTCVGNPILVQSTVTSLYNIFKYYKWQRKPVSGGGWITLSTDSAAPVWNGTAYQYTSSYNVLGATFADNGDQYRLVVATTIANLSGTTCVYTDVVPITLTVLPSCVLEIDFLSVSGRLEDNKGRITWLTSKEDGSVKYELQKSTDGISFATIANIDGYKNPSFSNNQYNYLDNAVVNGKVYYRVVMINTAGTKKYSRVIQLQVATNDFELLNVVNPFTSQLNFDINSTIKGEAAIQLLDQTGRMILKQQSLVYKGVNAIAIPNTQKLSGGIYILRVENNGVIYTRKVVKL
jgi:trimeric autotransporter adhesin